MTAREPQEIARVAVATGTKKTHRTWDRVLFSAFLDTRTVELAEQLGVRECVSKDRVQDLPALLHRHLLAL